MQWIQADIHAVVIVLLQYYTILLNELKPGYLQLENLPWTARMSFSAAVLVAEPFDSSDKNWLLRLTFCGWICGWWFCGRKRWPDYCWYMHSMVRLTTGQLASSKTLLWPISFMMCRYVRLIQKKVTGIKRSFLNTCERSDGGQVVWEKGSVPWNNKEHSSYCRDVVSCRGVAFGIQGVAEPRLKISVKLQMMR